MVSGYWQDVIARDLQVPEDRRLDDLTAELTRLLGSTDPHEREDVAYPTLATWVDRGVYDDLLTGLGDGMAAGLAVGLGERNTDTVFRRSFSVLVLAECIDRDNRGALVPQQRILAWGDRVMAWLVREKDTRGYVPGRGWAHAVAHGADALGALARSAHFGMNELTVLLDVVADRVLMPGQPLLTAQEPDRLAFAVIEVLRRNVVPLTVLEPWVERITVATRARVPVGTDPMLVRGNAEAFLRALHLQLLLGPRPPIVRPDLLLVLTDALRRANPWSLQETDQ